jgi:alpha-galactosidase
MDRLPPLLRIDGPETSVVFDLRRGYAELAYIGAALPADEDLGALADAQRRSVHESEADLPVPPSILPQGGAGFLGTPALALAQDGVGLPTGFRLVQAEPAGNGARLRFRDRVLAAQIEVHWQFAPSGMIRVETELSNQGGGPLQVLSLASLALPIPGWATRLARFAGRWAAEMREAMIPFEHGVTGSASHGGRPGFGGSQWVLLHETQARSAQGRVLAAHLAWSGDSQFGIERDADGRSLLLMAARLDPGEIVVRPGERFRAPLAYFHCAARGRDGAAQAFHRHVLGEVSPAAARGPRKVHLNSWEALGYRMDLPRLLRLADDAAAMGVERFVLDDGWFTGRRDDRSSLGDWTPDPALFPDGLGPLIERVHGLGMDFGLWVEPEMISPDSALYRKHPDWCLANGAAERPTQRRQLVLDLTVPDVSDHLFEVIDRLLRTNAIACLKWDHNRDLFPLAGKGFAQTKALYHLLDRIRLAHPAVEIETCASGGGRVDLEMLGRCTRYWASDNNDAIERLRINQGWFQFLPLALTGNHVGPSPNPITGRFLAMDFRAKVALFGHMGVEADPAAMTPEDRACLAAHIALYKEWRTVLHQGALTQIACETQGVYGWLAMHGDRGLALAAQTAFAEDFNAAAVRLPGLKPHGRYRVRLARPWPQRAARYLAGRERWEEGLVLSGGTLAEAGLALPLTHPETAWLIAVELIA